MESTSESGEPPKKTMKIVTGEPSINPYTKQFDVEDEFHSLRLLIEDRIFYVSPSILAHHSPVFRAMLMSTNGYEEKKTAEIKLPGKKADDILILLQVLHLFQPVDGTVTRTQGRVNA
jgi:hypothetical protein